MQPVKLHSSTYRPAGVSVQLSAVFRQEPMFSMTSREANMTSLSMLQSHTSTSWQETITSLRRWMMRLLRRLKTELRRSDSATSSCSGSASQLPSSNLLKMALLSSCLKQGLLSSRLNSSLSASAHHALAHPSLAHPASLNLALPCKGLACVQHEPLLKYA